MNIAENIQKLKAELPDRVKIIPISKRQPEERLQEAYDAGQRIFGENKAQDLQERYEKFPKDIEWHFVGHLQRNKVKYIAPYVKIIHSVDSLRLLKKINKEAEKNSRSIDCLLQLHIADEESKFGLSCQSAEEIVKSEDFKQMKNIHIVGLMAMATNTDDTEKVRREFKQLKSCFDRLKEKYFSDTDYFEEISAGMTNDYPIAVDEGSTMIRVGSLIFGERKY
jgi:pyridoxal phosphate enzyme (YggS family)